MFGSARSRILGLALTWLVAACSSISPTAEPQELDVLPPGSFAEAARDDVAIHRTAGDAVVVNHVFTGEKVHVVSEPVVVEGEAWIRVQYGDFFGWIEVDPASDGDPLIEVEPDCPDDPFGRTLTVKEVADLTQAERLYCLGGGTVTLEPVISRELPSDIPYGGSPDWLADEPSLELHGQGGFMSADGPLGAHIDSASDLALADGQWYVVEGRFDDLAALTCQRRIIADELGNIDVEDVVSQLPPVIAEDAVLWCRQQFVITALRPRGAPGPIAQPRPEPAGGSWRPIPAAPIVGRSEHGAAWTGTELIVWGGWASRGEATGHEFFAAADGAAYDPVTDAWRTLAVSPLAGRSRPILAWAGDELLVVGGFDSQFQGLADAAAYDPATDQWRPIARMPDAVVEGYAWAWTGSELVILAADGTAAAAYHPAADTWRELPPPPLPDDLYNMGATWTGTEVVALAYPNGVSTMAVAASYDPLTDQWEQLPESPIVALWGMAGPIWTGEEILAVSRSLSTGIPDDIPPDTTYVAQYDPAEGTWRTAGVQSAFQEVRASVWMGDRLFSSEAIYVPATDKWLVPPQHPPRELESPVWTGTEVLYWGGGPGGEALNRLNDGLAYRP
jgi:hypothetical protein